MDRGGLSGDDGPTHHGLFDISYLRGVPNIIHMVPKDEDELADMMYTALQQPGPTAVRYPRGTGPGATVKAHPVALPIGKAEIISDGDDVAIFGLGALLPMAQQLAAELRQQGFSAAVINPRFVKPLDRDVLAEYARRAGVIVTFEDHVLMGGFGSAVLEALSDMQIEALGSAHRLARPLYRARQGRPVAGQTRHQRRSSTGEASTLSAAQDPQTARRALKHFRNHCGVVRAARCGFL